VCDYTSSRTHRRHIARQDHQVCSEASGCDNTLLRRLHEKLASAQTPLADLVRKGRHCIVCPMSNQFAPFYRRARWRNKVDGIQLYEIEMDPMIPFILRNSSIETSLLPLVKSVQTTSITRKAASTLTLLAQASSADRSGTMITTGLQSH
jgi:hypothetical protein